MSFTNSYQPAPPPAPLTDAKLYGPTPYDTNWVFPIHTQSLATARVQLVPFVPAMHADAYWAAGAADADLWRYYPVAWRTRAELLGWVEAQRQQPANMLFAILDTTRGGAFAGVLGLFGCSAVNLSAEIAYVAVLPPFQRTHVATHAVGLLLRYCLELPGASPPGLGLRRVQWCAHARNVASARLAERMGFVREGVRRWMWVLPEQLMRDGEKPREGDKWPEKPGRHTVVLACCWDDWEGGAREVVQNNIDRRT